MSTHTSRRRLKAAAVLSLASAILLAGCGNGDDGDAIEAPATSSAAPSGTPSPTPLAGDGVQGATGSTGDGINGGTALDVGNVVPQEDVFSVESPWNLSVLDLGVHPRSEQLLENSKIRTSIGFNGEPQVETVEDGVYINTREWTVPVVADGVPTTLTCRQILCGDGGEDITLDIPEDVDPDPLYDGWFTVFDPSSNTAYDLWRARREDDGTISYHFMRTWNLDGPGFSRPYVVSARGSGLPLFAGLVRPGELERGQINHALAISIPGPAADFFVQPASSTDGNNQRNNSLPEGARIRLKADFQLERPFDTATNRFLPFNAEQRKYANYIIAALKRYGAIVVDRAAVPTLYFQKQILEEGRQPVLNGYELQSIGLEDFVTIDYSGQKAYPYPPENEDVAQTDLNFAADVAPSDGSGSQATSTDTTPETR